MTPCLKAKTLKMVVGEGAREDHSKHPPEILHRPVHILGSRDKRVVAVARWDTGSEKTG